MKIRSLPTTQGDSELSAKVDCKMLKIKLKHFVVSLQMFKHSNI